MLNGKKIVVVMPAYNAARTLRRIYDEVIAQRVVDRVIIVDDASRDETTALARGCAGARVYTHPSNLGYGANQKTCYRLALEEGADVIIMVHADYQYTPKLIPVMAALIEGGLYHVVIGSRILGGRALQGGMPLWKYIGNRGLTLVQNFLLGAKVSEYHTGYRAFSREVLERLPLHANSDDFVFDSQMLAQVLWFGYVIAEVTCPTVYAPESSSIDLRGSIRYGLGCLVTAARFWLAKHALLTSALFPAERAGQIANSAARR